MSITMDEEIKRWTGTAQIGADSGDHPGQEEGGRPAGVNKKAVQRIFQLKGGQVHKRAVRHRPRIEALPSVKPDERWKTDLCRVRSSRVHHPALPVAERDGRAPDPNAEGAMRAPAPLREPVPCLAPDR